LLALGGEQSFGEGGWLETPLSYLLPIAFDPNRNPRSARFSVKVRAQPTDAAIDHPALKMATGNVRPQPCGRSSRRSRSSTPSIRVPAPRYFSVETIARAVVFTPQDSWVWAMNARVNSPAHERFWRALLAWLVDGVS